MRERGRLRIYQERSQKSAAKFLKTPLTDSDRAHRDTSSSSCICFPLSYLKNCLFIFLELFALNRAFHQSIMGLKELVTRVETIRWWNSAATTSLLQQWMDHSSKSLRSTMARWFDLS
ncbi:unnamed protein product [Arabidopsis thaliana]|uniref:Uncharacterized protein n=1 Tax=Arabidopsis thaliana TaxID=3702 RepID=A0A654EZ64_ARATH|nr:unnamed protein product [Arabidopsis thaliana]